MSAVPRLTTVAVLLLAMVGLCHGLAPSGLECGQGLLEVGLENLTTIVTPCALGASSTCCNGINPIFKLARGAKAPGCLCNNLILDEVVGVLESNELASAIGFGRTQLLNVLQECGTNYFGGTGDAACPNVEPVGIKISRPRLRNFGVPKKKKGYSGGLFGGIIGKSIFQKNIIFG